jgi:hypothetical protein
MKYLLELSRLTRGIKPRKKRNALVINCSRGEEVLRKLGMRRDTKVGTLYDKFYVQSWNKVLEAVLG